MLAAFDGKGKKVLSLFKFVPGEFCILIEKNQMTLKSAEAGSKKGDKYEGGPH